VWHRSLQVFRIPGKNHQTQALNFQSSATQLYFFVANYSEQFELAVSAGGSVSLLLIKANCQILRYFLFFSFWMIEF